MRWELLRLSNVPAVLVIPERSTSGSADGPRTTFRETRWPVMALAAEPDYLEFLQAPGTSALVRGVPLDTGRITVRLAPHFGAAAERAFAAGGFLELPVPGRARPGRYRLVGLSADPWGGEVILRCERFEE